METHAALWHAVMRTGAVTAGQTDKQTLTQTDPHTDTHTPQTPTITNLRWLSGKDNNDWSNHYFKFFVSLVNSSTVPPGYVRPAPQK